jgi:hypothetical protein
MACRNRALRKRERAEAKCKSLGHSFGERVDNINHDSPYLPQGLVGWSKTCARCGYHTGRGEY